MASYSTLDPEQIIVCPLDKNHEMPAKRLQYHLIKCRRNFTGIEFATCPFNARHVMPKRDIRYHIANCPDKAMLEPILSYELSKNHEGGKHFKGCTDLPKYEDQSRPRSAENWDEEIPDNPRIGVDPAYFAKMEYKDLSGMSRSEKKAVRGQYYLPPDQRTYPLQEAQKEEVEEDLPKPHSKMSKFMVAQPPQQQSQVLSYSLAMAGIGRGRAAMSQPNYSTAGRAHKIAAVDSPVAKGYNNAVIADAKKKQIKKKVERIYI
ncbi:gametocyte-specific factor 1 homolog isoform X2 [Mytilus californianus]|uniref:gametocyte-specific factor 1 homolog isoform X2 n=1 Tax=Mytilus californianus TaxID=6549 RepID=UPI0022450A20|nr:gametocyte-specific factor 1 homolog isoform X2 [Mytilus californianus]